MSNLLSLSKTPSVVAAFKLSRREQSGRKKKKKKMRGVNSHRLIANTPGVKLDLGV